METTGRWAEEGQVLSGAWRALLLRTDVGGERGEVESPPLFLQCWGWGRLWAVTRTNVNVHLTNSGKVGGNFCSYPYAKE